MMASFTESVVEEAALAWLESLGYTVKHGPAIAPENLSQSGRNLLQRCNRSSGPAWRATLSEKETVGFSDAAAVEREEVRN